MLKILIFPILILNGCAIQYFDDETGSQHLFGIGHMVMKVEKDNAQQAAVFSGLSIFGFGIGNTSDGFSLSCGWSDHQSINVLEPNASFQLTWPRADWLNIKIGQWPNDGLPESEI